MAIRGSVDCLNETRLEGWMLDEAHPGTKIELEVMIGDRVIGRIVADQFRADLQAAGLGDGNCAFSFAMPKFFGKQDLGQLRIRFADTALFLATPHSARESEDGVRTSSDFGGLWIDRTDWLDRIGRKHRAGEISDDLSVRLFRFARDGYTVIPGAVDNAVIERVKHDIDAAWQRPPAGLLIETFEPDGAMRYIPPDTRWRSGRTKLLDFFAYSAAAREAIASPKVVEFLSAVFEDRPKAFQTLNFHTGSEQAIHKDTAYVKVDGNPLALAATWIALEDIEEGTGELEYFIGSHRAPDFRFGGVSKWMEDYSQEHPAFLRSLHADAEAFGHTRGKFLARRGDVLVWHADLAHGGSPVTKPEKTRQSLVTHFCPAAHEPFYRRDSLHPAITERGCVFISQYGPIAPLAAAA